MQRHELRVDPEEAQEVVRLAAHRQAAPMADGPTVDGLAEALGLPPEEVERLLSEVRGRRAAVAPERRFGDRSAALSAGLVLALVVVVALVGLGGFLMFRHVPAAEPPMLISTPDGTVKIGPNEMRIDGFNDDTPKLAPPAPTTPPEPGFTALGEQAMRQTIQSLRQQLPKAETPENRAQIQKALEQLETEFKAQFGKEA